LYELKVKLINDGVLYDEEIIKIGFREIEFNKDSGFFINGKNEKLKGVCLHHDHAGVGVAVDKNILRYRLKKLKDMGCNAIRTSHNPQSPEFYDLCDELGFYVMNEVRHFSSTENGLGELTDFVKRDRNHPCVILWSLFNEEPLQCSAIGEKIINTMIKTLHKYDRTRPVTGGMNGPLEINGVVKYVDVMGFNYLQYGYDEFHRLFPNIPIIGSETGSYLSTRDEIISDRKSSHVSCFGRELWGNL
jgi:beta-galactosidase